MKDALICIACICALLIAAVCWFSVGSTIQWNAEADGVLKSDLNASGIIESARSATSQETPALPCPECAGYVLTDYRTSPTVYGPKGLYKGHLKGDEFIFDTPTTMENLFGKKPVK